MATNYDKVRVASIIDNMDTEPKEFIQLLLDVAESDDEELENLFLDILAEKLTIDYASLGNFIRAIFTLEDEEDLLTLFDFVKSPEFCSDERFNDSDEELDGMKKYASMRTAQLQLSQAIFNQMIRLLMPNGVNSAELKMGNYPPIIKQMAEDMYYFFTKPKEERPKIIGKKFINRMVRDRVLKTMSVYVHNVEMDRSEIVEAFNTALQIAVDLLKESDDFQSEDPYFIVYQECFDKLMKLGDYREANKISKKALKLAKKLKAGILPWPEYQTAISLRNMLKSSEDSKKKKDVIAAAKELNKIQTAAQSLDSEDFSIERLMWIEIQGALGEIAFTIAKTAFAAEFRSAMMGEEDPHRNKIGGFTTVRWFEEAFKYFLPIFKYLPAIKGLESFAACFAFLGVQENIYAHFIEDNFDVLANTVQSLIDLDQEGKLSKEGLIYLETLSLIASTEFADMGQGQLAEDTAEVANECYGEIGPYFDLKKLFNSYLAMVNVFLLTEVSLTQAEYLIDRYSKPLRKDKIQKALEYYNFCVKMIPNNRNLLNGISPGVTLFKGQREAQESYEIRVAALARKVRKAERLLK